jgi:chromosome segregation ATPase
LYRSSYLHIVQGNMYKDNITNIRLQVKNMTTQKEQLEELLKEKRLQCEDQEQILTDLRIELDEKTNEAEKYKSEIEQLKGMDSRCIFVL